MTKVEIIKETGEYYNLSNRGIDKYGSCVYIAEDGKMCAVGRCLKTYPSRNEDYAVEDLIDDYGQDLFKDQYKGHSVEFWKKLQRFHDSHTNFTYEGLSEYGKSRLNYLIEMFKDD